MGLETGKKYKWKHEPQILYYTGKINGWYTFLLNGSEKMFIFDSCPNLNDGLWETVE